MARGRGGGPWLGAEEGAMARGRGGGPWLGAGEEGHG